MKGLLIKDFCLMKNQKNFFIVIIVIAAMLLYTNPENTLFVVMYVTILSSFFTLSTISYDDYDNGSPFLFSMPITRMQYALGKYIFAFITSCIGWVFSSLIAYAIGNSKGMIDDMSSWWLSVVVYLGVVFIAIAVMLPIQIKFGAEKSRIATLAVGGIIIILVCFSKTISEKVSIDLSGIINGIFSLKTGVLATIAVIVIAIAEVISIMVTNKILQNKEF